MQGGFHEADRTRSIIGAFFTTYNKLGAGFLESVYAAALEKELVRKGHVVQREVPVQVLYDGEPLAFQRIDFLVDRLVVLEFKSCAHLSSRATRQLHNYLRATNLSLGLLLHFGERPHVHRVFVPHA